MQRLTIKKTDDVALVVEQFIDTESDVVVLEIPEGALFGQNTTNFKLLKREAALLGREVIIETTDEAIRERAVKAGLGIGESLATIEAIEEPAVPVKTKKKGVSRKPRTVRVAVVSEKEDEPTPAVSVESDDVTTKFMTRVRSQLNEGPRETRRGGREPMRPASLRSKKIWRTVFIAGGVAGAVLVYLAVVVLPRATIALSTEKKSWNFDGSLVVDKNLSRIDVSGGRIPGEMFIVKDRLTKRVAATGKQYVSRKAEGTLTIYNEYSSQPQSIVANTRFVTPGGIVFRTVKALTIPGAKIESGRIIASSIEAMVVADKAGVESNVGPTSRLTIPGFAKTPKFDGFYGQLKTGTTGGFVGNTSVPTDQDVASAKSETLKQLTTQLLEKKSTAVSEGFISPDGASSVSVLSQMVESVADAAGTVGVTTEAQLSVFAFREEDIKALLQSRVRGVIGPEYEVATEKIVYSPLNAKTLALSTGRMSVPLIYDVEMSYVITEAQIKEKLAGRHDSELNEIIFQIPGITGGTVEFWPFYVGTVPRDEAKIKVELH